MHVSSVHAQSASTKYAVYYEPPPSSAIIMKTPQHYLILPNLDNESPNVCMSHRSVNESNVLKRGTHEIRNQSQGGKEESCLSMNMLNQPHITPWYVSDTHAHCRASKYKEISFTLNSKP